MHEWGNWMIFSIPLYVVLTRTLKRPASDVAMWAYLWFLAAFSAANAWHAYRNWLACQHLDMGSRGLDLLGQNLGILRFALAETAFLVIYPVVRHWRLRRAEARPDAGTA